MRSVSSMVYNLGIYCYSLNMCSPIFFQIDCSGICGGVSCVLCPMKRRLAASSCSVSQTIRNLLWFRISDLEKQTNQKPTKIPPTTKAPLPWDLATWDWNAVLPASRQNKLSLCGKPLITMIPFLVLFNCKEHFCVQVQLQANFMLRFTELQCF